MMKYKSYSEAYSLEIDKLSVIGRGNWGKGNKKEL